MLFRSTNPITGEIIDMPELRMAVLGADGYGPRVILREGGTMGLNCAVLWAVNFVRNRFWILLTPFIIYIFVFCMVHFVNRVSLSPVMFLRPSAPFRNDIRVVICAFIILIVVNIIFYIHAVKKELVAYE